MGRGARRASLAAAVLAAAGSLAACRRAGDLAPVSVLQVLSADLAPALSEAGLDAAATAGIARDALASAGFRLDERARRGYRATLEIVAVSVAGPRAGEAAGAEVVVELRVEQNWAVGPSPRRSGRGRAPLSGARPAAWREALRQATLEAASAVVLDLRALQRPVDRLVADLGSGDPRARERSVRALASRGARGATPAIAALVRDPDPLVARAAVDALASFKDPASARALIDAAQIGDVGTTLRLIPVLVDVGGPDVEGYLLTLEAGHADPVVRRAAADGLARFPGRRSGRGLTP